MLQTRRPDECRSLVERSFGSFLARRNAADADAADAARADAAADAAALLLSLIHI